MEGYLYSQKSSSRVELPSKSTTLSSKNFDKIDRKVTVTGQFAQLGTKKNSK
jgi:hypothetical protein